MLNGGANPRICLATASLWDRDILEALRLAGEVGYDAVEIVIHEGKLPLRELRRRKDEILREVEAMGMKVAALTTTTNLSGPDRNRDIELLKEVMRIAPGFGTHIVKLPSGRPSSKEAKREHWTECIESLTVCAEEALRLGVKLAMETHLRMLSDTTRGTLRLLEEVDSPALGITLDFCNVYESGDDPLHSIDELKERVFFVHVKDGLRLPDGSVNWVPLGKGDLDYPALITRLREVGYRGVFSVEILWAQDAYRMMPEEGLGTPEAVVAHDQQVLRGLIRQYGG